MYEGDLVMYNGPSFFMGSHRIISGDVGQVEKQGVHVLYVRFPLRGCTATVPKEQVELIARAQTATR